MKSEIEKFKKENGNRNFTVKELLMYNISRTDRVYDKLAKGAGKIATNKTAIEGLQKSDNRLWKFIYGLIFVIVGLAIKVIWP